MNSRITTIFGKSIRSLARLRGGSGSAIPGLFVEKIDPDFVRRTLEQLPRGVVVVSGSNGKTTTTKMVVELLESQGLKVFTNRTGSNFVRGVAAALLSEVDSRGVLSADIAVVELDEAHAVHFVKAIAPRFSLILNVMRDQLDRFGEIDHTTALLSKVAAATTEHVVLNREDPRIAAIGNELPSGHVSYFGLSEHLLELFPSDDELRGDRIERKGQIQATVTLDTFKDGRATFLIGERRLESAIKIEGIYNIFNAAAALALVIAIVGDKLDSAALLARLGEIEPAFGRGETFNIDGQPLEFVLVKNPSGFRLGLRSFDPTGVATMIAINDNYADGRDMSWLWDVEFDSLRNDGVQYVSGVRAYDMALRLQYDDVPFSTVETRLDKALRGFLTDQKESPKRVYCTYTAMLALRRELGKIIPVEEIDS